MARGSVALPVAIAALLATTPSAAFPPYRTTDAGTADPFLLEAHAGLVEVERADHTTTLASPLAQLSFGLPAQLEIPINIAYLPDDGELRDASAGLKWVPFGLGELSFGVELGVGFPPTGDDPFGLAGTLLGTYAGELVQLHVNAGAFSDLSDREDAERGLSAGVLAELDFGAARPGLELVGRAHRGRTDRRADGHRLDRRARRRGSQARHVRGTDRRRAGSARERLADDVLAVRRVGLDGA